ncbi:MAG TPA: DNA polymerase III subunit chi [Rhizomicrobium sp.]|nr:DNA polymerase III subunit chi [Rhizomicrobium sp.]
MTETLFYHLERRSLDDVLPGLIEKTLERGWRAVIRTESSERADAIDTLLWTYNEQSFLAHAQSGEGDPKRQPVLITVEDENPNAANVLFCVGGAMPSWKAVDGLTRVVLMFDGRDEAALGRARDAWKDAKAAGHDVTYWKESASGKFEKQG